MNILMVLTSHSKLGKTGQKTGFWAEEFAAPYYVFADAGMTISLASPKGGQPPIDPKSELPDAQTTATKRMEVDVALKEKLAHTLRLTDVSATDFDAVFYPGGHGPLWDLSQDAVSISLIENFFRQKKPMSFVCHAPAALLKAKTPEGHPLLMGRTVTGFSNTEEEAVHLTEVVPFLLEDELKKTGGQYSKRGNWKSYVKKDGQLITGQNPQSSGDAAKMLLEVLRQQRKQVY